MNNRENFLTRWSRRKHAVTAETAETVSPAAVPVAPEEAVGSSTAAAERADGHGGASPSAAPTSGELPFNPLTLPPIESITVDTDIRGFFAPGVPPELTRAALRRAWAADPKIRDFVGLADYDWDFNAPGSMAGFGSLEMTDELRRLAARIIGPDPSSDQPVLNPPSAKITSNQNLIAQAQSVGQEGDHFGPVQNAPVEQPAGPCNQDDLTQRSQDGGSTQGQTRKAEKSESIICRRHGGALPR